jgi:preprotein translocase subunit SecB
VSPEHLSSGGGQLVGVRVHDLAFRVTDDYEFDEPLNYVIVTSSNVSLADDMTSGQILFHAAVGWTVANADEDDDPVKGPFDLDLTLEAHFALTGTEIDTNEFSDWIEFNSEHLLWPYLRTEIASITTSAGLPPLTIYTIAVPVFRYDAMAESPSSSSELPESSHDITDP